MFVVARESFFSARAEFESRAQEAHGHLRDRLQANDMALFNFAGLLSTLGAGDRDRVEIYRPLLADPKEVRKKRAAEGKAMKKGAGEPGAGDAG